jgi:hypothetical protein
VDEKSYYSPLASSSLPLSGLGLGGVFGAGGVLSIRLKTSSPFSWSVSFGVSGMTFEDDPWVKENSGLGIARLHALGNVAINWNRCERRVEEIFEYLLSAGPDVSRIISHDLGAKTIWVKIFDLAKYRGLREDEQAALKHASALSDINRGNRNLIVHADILPNSSYKDADDILKLIRRHGPTTRYRDIECSVEDIRKVSDDIKNLHEYIRDILISIMVRKMGRHGQPLPDKPPLPVSMVLPDPAQAPGK